MNKIRIVKPNAKDIFVIYPDKDTPSAFKAFRKSDTIEIDIDEMVDQWMDKNVAYSKIGFIVITTKLFSQYLQEVLNGK